MKIPGVVAIDFDGTCVLHEYPEVGPDVLHAERVIKRMVAEGSRVILWTMRSGESLQDAVKWFADKGIPLYGVNENPAQGKWTQSPKAYAQLYIDDAAFGCPLITPGKLGARPCVDWLAVESAILGGNRT